MIWELLISFPVDLLWGILLFQLFVRPNGRYAVIAIAVGVIVIGIFVPDKIQIVYWNPSGLVTIVLASLLHLLLVPTNEALGKALSMELPSRKEIRDVLVKTKDVEDRQKIYAKIIREYADFWKKKSAVLSEINTRYSTIILGGVWVVIFLFWGLSYYFNPSLIDRIKEQFELLNKNFMQITGKTDETLIDIAPIFSLYIKMAPAILFVEISVILILFLYLLRRVFARNHHSMVIIGYITLFAINEKVVWGFIVLGVLTLVSLNYPIPQFIELFSLNLLAILAFVYLIQGLGIFNLFLTVRLLPANWILFTIFAMGIFLPQIILFVLFFLLLIGLGDFWFNFRNKALHPKAVFHNDDY